MRIDIEETSQLNILQVLSTPFGDCPLIKLDSYLAQQYSGWARILKDLEEVELSIKKFLDIQNNDWEHFRSILITYRKCFVEAKGRKIKIDNFSYLDNKQLEFHKNLMEIAHQYIAHSDDSLCEQIIVFLALDPSDANKAIGVSHFLAKKVIFSRDELKDLLELIPFFKVYTNKKMKKISDKLINEYNQKL